jgi:hypothetical protein
MTDPITSEQLWLLSFYRSSEISGALLFGRLARAMRPGGVQADMTRHFADEAQHAALWTSCIEQLGAKPLRVNVAYQDRYLEAAGLPANIMEVLAITQVFEQRVLNQYARHLHLRGSPPAVSETLRRIMQDERWHVTWVRRALAELSPSFGEEAIRSALRRCRLADRIVYAETVAEHADHISFLTTSGDEPDRPGGQLP